MSEREEAVLSQKGGRQTDRVSEREEAVLSEKGGRQTDRVSEREEAVLSENQHLLSAEGKGQFQLTVDCGATPDRPAIHMLLWSLL